MTLSQLAFQGDSKPNRTSHGEKHKQEKYKHIKYANHEE